MAQFRIYPHNLETVYKIYIRKFKVVSTVNYKTIQAVTKKICKLLKMSSTNCF